MRVIDRDGEPGTVREREAMTVWLPLPPRSPEADSVSFPLQSPLDVSR